MTLNFDAVNATLKQFDMEIDAAYFHGLLSGLVCAGVQDDEIDDWLPALFANRFMSEEDYQQYSDHVLGSFQSVRAELDQDGFGFQILLPDEQIPMHYRVEMMGSWCQGFRMALIDYAETAIESLPDDCAEFVDDVANLVAIEADDDEPQDRADESFMMLEEHLRVGVQLVFEHMNPLQPN